MNLSLPGIKLHRTDHKQVKRVLFSNADNSHSRFSLLYVSYQTYHTSFPIPRSLIFLLSMIRHFTHILICTDTDRNQFLDSTIQPYINVTVYRLYNGVLNFIYIHSDIFYDLIEPPFNPITSTLILFNTLINPPFPYGLFLDHLLKIRV